MSTDLLPTKKPPFKILDGKKLVSSHQYEVLTKIQIKEMYVRGYDPVVIHKTINETREKSGFAPLRIHTIKRYIREMKSEGSEWYLSVLKDQITYINWHRFKLEELNGIKHMLYDKIQNEGGLTFIPARTLVAICKVLHDVISTQSTLEQQIPYVNSMYAQAKNNQSPEQLRMLEAQIIESIDDPDMKKKYNEIRMQEIKKAEEDYNKDPNNGKINLSEYPEDTYIV
ncbi:hypothetical protein [Candidatus Nitrosocosmicus sp. SS]|uniref:hypothetical protein n=1 Tax=Candidatus Nitrosocosmicus agrestis TaxID=2563600 RepID=UPI00122E9E9E|nr:hypothetical protein [Candidatus Nitrosocosmicus sp. SS]KAA2279057.1 hypothetical protein F1Z66_14360 [Candidatus Nitrosocosmicus sp. SS]KAF0867654.1 hypothetical protein E5N71_14255 [Candidatus Nitrosocosmicus sp. SS]